MYTFNYENRIRSHFQFIAFVNSGTCFKAKCWQCNFLTVDSLLQITVKIRKIQCIKRFKIIFTFFIFRCMLSVQKIIVQRNTHRMNKVGDQLNLQTFTKGGFSGRRRTRDKNHPHPIVAETAGYFLCYFGYRFFLHGFRNHNNFGSHPFSYRLVQIANIIQPHRIQQSEMLLISLKHLILLNYRFKLLRVGPTGYSKQNAIEIGNNVKQLDISGRRC